jgi:hypothetical protein
MESSHDLHSVARRVETKFVRHSIVAVHQFKSRQDRGLVSEVIALLEQNDLVEIDGPPKLEIAAKLSQDLSFALKFADLGSQVPLRGNEGGIFVGELSRLDLFSRFDLF